MTTTTLKSLARISTRCSTLQHIKISIKKCVHSSIMQNCNCICCSWKVLWLLNKCHQLLIRQRWILVGRTACQDKRGRQRERHSRGKGRERQRRNYSLKYCTCKSTKPHPHKPNWAKVKPCPSFCVSSPNKLTHFCLFTNLFNGTVCLPTTLSLLVLTPHLSFFASISSYSLNSASTTETTVLTVKRGSNKMCWAERLNQTLWQIWGFTSLYSDEGVNVTVKFNLYNQ